MFEKENQFYPTPKKLVEKLLKPWRKSYTDHYGLRGEYYNLGKLKILEPSAGKGDILDAITSDNRPKPNTYCIEIDPNLQEILKGKGYKVIAEDFMDYNEDYIFDMVLMNPPFNHGVDHVLKAWDVLTLGGEIAAIINAETVLNPYSEKRKLLLSYIEQYGSYEIVENAFSEAEHKTDVTVALVWISKPKKENPFDFKFDGQTELEGDFNITPESATNELKLNDQTGAMIEAYDNTKSAFIDYMKARAKLQFYAKPLFKNVQDAADASLKTHGANGDAYNEFVDSLKMASWKHILKTVGIDRLMTSNVQKNFGKFTEGQGSMALTKENINKLVMMLVQNSGTILNQAVIDVFDLFTQYHKENRCHVEGWKTNDSWKVNKKIILPNYVTMGYGEFFTTSTYRWDEFRDIDKAMCYLTKSNYSEIKKIDDTIKEYPIGSTTKLSSEFFDIRCYKKGTVHLFFRDVDLWARFNQVACEGKQWLG